MGYSPITTMVLHGLKVCIIDFRLTSFLWLSTCASTWKFWSSAFDLRVFDSFVVTPPTLVVMWPMIDDISPWHLPLFVVMWPVNNDISTYDLLMVLVVGNWCCHWLLSFSFTDFDATMSLPMPLPMPLSEMSNFYSATVFKGHRQTCRHSNFWCGNRIAPSKEGCRNIPCGVSGFVIGHSDATSDSLVHVQISCLQQLPV